MSVSITDFVLPTMASPKNTTGKTFAVAKDAPLVLCGSFIHERMMKFPFGIQNAFGDESKQELCVELPWESAELANMAKLDDAIVDHVFNQRLEFFKDGDLTKEQIAKRYN